jgi:site-specific recombinase XerD
MNLPSSNEYKKFADIFYSDRSNRALSVRHYEKITNKFEDANEIIKLPNSEYKCLNSIKIFLILSLKLKLNEFVNVKIDKPLCIINFFCLADEDFWSFFNKYNVVPKRKTLFLLVLIRLVIQFELFNIKDLNYEHINAFKNALNLESFEYNLKELVALYKAKRMRLPSLQEYINFYQSYSECKVYVIVAKKNYIDMILKVSNVEEIINSNEIKSNLKLFILISSKEAVNQKIDIPIIFPERIIRYFGLADEEFWHLYNNHINGNDHKKHKFLSNVIRILLHLGKRKVSDLKYEDIKTLYSDQCCYLEGTSRHFIPLVEKIIIRYQKEAKPTVARIFSYIEPEDIDRFGTDVKEYVNLIKEYLEICYIQKGYITKEPLSNIKAFFSWLLSNYPEVVFIKDIDGRVLDEYKRYVINFGYAQCTIAVKLSMLNRFFQWLYEEGKINNVFDIRERYSIKSQSKSRMFQNREHFKKVLNEIMLFSPKDEQEYLIKHFLLIASATGLRISEVVWLGPDCLKSSSENVGEITLQVREKQRTQNKTTSIMPWGIASINELNCRFHDNNMKIKFYHQNTRDYFYSLFQHNEKLLGFYDVRNILGNLFDKANLRDEQGNPTDYKNIKTHAFRHQKFNDIFEATNGSLTAVKIDSGHKTIEMAKKYTRQSTKKKQIEAIKLIEEGKIAGKSAEILKNFFNINIEPMKYIEVVKKMNILDMEKTLSKNIKSLGFGLCFASKCKLSPICESCDYYIVSDNESEILKQKYSNNYQILKSKSYEIGTEDFLKNENNFDFIEEIKYQEKWLKELGITDEEINRLRENIYEGIIDGE